VYVMLPGDDRVLNFNEMEVYLEEFTRTATQSSALANGKLGSRNGNDGDRTTMAHSSAAEKNPWWQLDLGSDVAIDEVRILNRNGKCSSRLFTGTKCAWTSNSGTFDADAQGAIIGVSSSPCNGDSCFGHECARLTRPDAGFGYEYRIKCDGQAGRYVYVLLPGEERTLNFYEMEVLPTVTRALTFDRDGMAWCIGAKCLRSPAAHPVDAGSEGNSWEAVPLTNFDGKFEGAGVPKGPGRARMKRKMPKLISFGATQPEYANECKDEVTPGSASFDLEKMNEEGMALPEGNPCRNIAGAWVEQEPIMTHYGPLQPDPEGEGRSYWTNGGYDETDGELGAGTTYDSVLACADREISRDLQAATFERKHDTAENSFDMAFTWGSAVCNFMPDAEVSPMGFGVSFPVSDVCEAAFEGAHATADFINNQVLIQRDWTMANNDNADCNSAQHGLSRIFCDLHCIRDAVKAGDQAILKSLANAVRVVGENTNLLAEYYSGMVQDSVDSLKESTESDSLIQTEQMRAGLQSSFFEMKHMLSSNLAAESRPSVIRALDGFAARFADPLPSSNRSSLNVSLFMSSLLERTEALHAVVRTAYSSEQWSTTARAAHHTASLTQRLQQSLKVRLGTLGVYRESASRAKEHQVRLLERVPSLSVADLLSEVRVSSARVLLLDLDETWWDLRGKLDTYLEATTSQVAAYDVAFVQLDAYVSKCSVGFPELKDSYTRAMHAEASAHRLLRKTWEDMSHSLGLLAAKIQDGDAFQKFAVLDIFLLGTSVVKEKESAICEPSNSENQAALLKRLESAPNQGFMGQTWNQVHTLFRQVPLLRDRFFAGGLRAPDHQTILQAWSSIVSSYAQTMGRRSELAWEWFTGAKQSRSC